METVACNLCGSSQATVLYTLPDLLLGRQEVRTTLVKCETCGLIYQNPRPSLAEMGQHYPRTILEPNTGGRRNRAHPPGSSARQSTMGFRGGSGQLPASKRMAACWISAAATGLFLSGFLKPPNWELHGVEPSEYAAQYCPGTAQVGCLPGDPRRGLFSFCLFSTPLPCGTSSSICTILPLPCVRSIASSSRMASW